MAERMMECIRYDKQTCGNGCKHVGVHKEIKECDELFFDSCRVLYCKVSCVPVSGKKDELVTAINRLTYELSEIKGLIKERLK